MGCIYFSDYLGKPFLLVIQMCWGQYWFLNTFFVFKGIVFIKGNWKYYEKVFAYDCKHGIFLSFNQPMINTGQV